MKCIVILILTTVAATAAAGPEETWLHAGGMDIQAAKIVAEVPRDSVFEVPVSMFEEAEGRLKSAAARKLQSYDVDALSRNRFSCAGSSTPFLVRAVFTNGNTGAFLLKRLDSALWVSHSSLGVSTGTHRSALLVCLNFNPSVVYVTAGGAM